MSKDPIVEEVRAIRDTYAKKFDYDTNAIYRDLKNQETQAGRKFISLPLSVLTLIERNRPKLIINCI